MALIKHGKGGKLGNPLTQKEVERLEEKLNKKVSPERDQEEKRPEKNDKQKGSEENGKDS